jgi:hypothetical protein
MNEGESGTMNVNNPVKVFIDTHLHLYNLSHIGLLAYVNRTLLNKSIRLEDFFKSRYFRIVWRIASSKNPLMHIVKKIVLALLVLGPICLGFLAFRFDLLDWFLSGPRSLIFDLTLVAVLYIGCLALVIIIVKFVVRDRLSKAFNMLSILENDICSMLLYIERDYVFSSLRRFGRDARVKNFIETYKSTLASGQVADGFGKLDAKFRNAVYDKVILTPLMMDFECEGYAGNGKMRYNLPPDKPIVDQVIDMFNGIKRYMQKSAFRLFEVYPFMGINPANYPCGRAFPVSEMGDDIRIRLFASMPDSVSEKVKMFLFENEDGIRGHYVVAIEDIDEDEELWWDQNMNGSNGAHPDKLGNYVHDICAESRVGSATKLLFKYFGDYDSTDDRLYDKFKDNYDKYFAKGKYNGDVDKIRSFFFAGIKLYPGLGFDPWPVTEYETKNTTNSGEWKIPTDILEKQKNVELLYRFCVFKNIPLTVHCQHMGFDSIDRKDLERNTNPNRWERVLGEQGRYKELKINFAHMGINDGWLFQKWVPVVAGYIKRNPNVYADFACKGWKPGFYANFLGILHTHGIRKDRIMFGSDFMIDLMYVKSYEEYLEKYLAFFSVEDSCKDMALLGKFSVDNPREFLFGSSNKM